MSSKEYIPEHYQKMIRDGFFVPESETQHSGKDPFADPYDDPNFDEDAHNRFEEEDGSAKTEAVDSIKILLESVDPLEGRIGAERLDHPDRIIISDPIINLTMRSHVYPDALPAAVKYEGVEYTRTVGNTRPSQQLEQQKAWETQPSPADSEEFDGAMRNNWSRAQVVAETLAFDIYRNPLLSGVCIGIAPWEQVIRECHPGIKSSDTEGFHIIAFRAARNHEMTGLLYDDPVKRSLQNLYSMIPERQEDILFEGRLLPTTDGEGKVEFIPEPIHVPQGIDDVLGFARAQRENAAQYLLNPTPESPSLVTRLMDPRCSKLVII